MVGMPMPSDAVFASSKELFRRLEHMHTLLVDPARTSVRVVLNLEKMVIKEAQRSFTYFHPIYENGLVDEPQVAAGKGRPQPSTGGSRAGTRLNRQQRAPLAAS